MSSALFQFLSNTSPGPLTSGEEFLQLVASEWHTFDGSDEGGMKPDKLHRGLEDINWIPPILSFCIERHGSFMLGSKNAEIQRWELNLQSRVASMHIERHRRLIPAEQGLDVTPIVQTVVEAVLGKNDVQFLKWRPDNSVTVVSGVLIPDTGLAKKTVQGRRKRFRTALTASLSAAGWIEVRANVYQLDPAGPSVRH